MQEDPPIHVESFIWKARAFQGEQHFNVGLTNHCNHSKKEGLFHLYLDCDDYANLRQILDRLDLLKERFNELSNAKFLILQTSPWHFSIASFVMLTWKRYLEVLWFAVEIGLEHEGHAVYSMVKGYAVLRTGAKDGVVPKILYSIGDTIACKQCYRDFVNGIEEVMSP